MINIFFFPEKKVLFRGNTNTKGTKSNNFFTFCREMMAWMMEMMTNGDDDDDDDENLTAKFRVVSKHVALVNSVDEHFITTFKLGIPILV